MLPINITIVTLSSPLSPPDRDSACHDLRIRDCAPNEEDNEDSAGGRDEVVQMGVWCDQDGQSEK